MVQLMIANDKVKSTHVTLSVEWWVVLEDCRAVGPAQGL